MRLFLQMLHVFCDDLPTVILLYTCIMCFDNFFISVYRINISLVLLFYFFLVLSFSCVPNLKWFCAEINCYNIFSDLHLITSSVSWKTLYLIGHCFARQILQLKHRIFFLEK